MQHCGLPGKGLEALISGLVSLPKKLSDIGYYLEKTSGMKKIAVDMNPVIHGSRAIKRCTGCMVAQLLWGELQLAHPWHIRRELTIKKEAAAQDTAAFIFH